MRSGTRQRPHGGQDRRVLRDRHGTAEVAGAVRVAGQLQFHLQNFLLSLAEKVVAAGGICERTRVTELHDGSRCRLSGEGGLTVEARDAVVATHYPVFDRTLLFTRLKPRRELVIAAPVRPEDAPAGIYITPDDGVCSMRSAPYEEGRRLLIVTGESFEPGAGKYGRGSRASTPGPGSEYRGPRRRIPPIAGQRRTTTRAITCRTSDTPTLALSTSLWPRASAAGA